MNTETHVLTSCPMCGCAVEKTRNFARFLDIHGEWTETELFVGVKCLCKTCGDIHDQNESAEKGAKAKERAWLLMLNERMPSDYREATVAQMSPAYARIFTWDQAGLRGGIGLVRGCGMREIMRHGLRGDAAAPTIPVVERH